MHKSNIDNKKTKMQNTKMQITNKLKQMTESTCTAVWIYRGKNRVNVFDHAPICHQNSLTDLLKWQTIRLNQVA